MNSTYIQPISLRTTLQINCPHCGKHVVRGRFIIVLAHNERLCGCFLTSVTANCCGRLLEVPHVFDDAQSATNQAMRLRSLFEEDKRTIAAPADDLSRLLEMTGSSLAIEQANFSRRVAQSLQAN